MKTFKKQVEEESKDYTRKCGGQCFEAGANFAARLIVEMIRNKKRDAIIHDEITPIFIADWLQKEIERES